MALRVGRVDYINTFPLAWSLERRAAGLDIAETLGVPTELNALLADGALDVANVSSIAYARHADELVLLPSVCISWGSLATSGSAMRVSISL